MITIQTLRAWVRDELQADLDTARQRSPAEWLAVVVETAVPLAVVVRVAAASWVWAINHNAAGATLNGTLRGWAIEADAWRPFDELQTSVLAAWVPAMGYHMPYEFGGPLWARAWLAVNAGVLGVLPLVAVARWLR
jgi:hypothetical protein